MGHFLAKLPSLRTCVADLWATLCAGSAVDVLFFWHKSTSRDPCFPRFVGRGRGNREPICGASAIDLDTYERKKAYWSAPVNQ